MRAFSWKRRRAHVVMSARADVAVADADVMRDDAEDGESRRLAIARPSLVLVILIVVTQLDAIGAIDAVYSGYNAAGRRPIGDGTIMPQMLPSAWHPPTGMERELLTSGKDEDQLFA